MFTESIIGKLKQTTAISANIHNKYKKYYPTIVMVVLFIIIMCVSEDSWADGSTTDTNTMSGKNTTTSIAILDNLLTLIQALLGGAFGKIIASGLLVGGVISGIKNPGWTTVSLFVSALIVGLINDIVDAMFAIAKLISG
ncbi:MAG: hypothetical protein HRU36_03035 [Rickettsiales bacterium]|nr:hypothetical protein [Rickettsiales bacterium]